MIGKVLILNGSDENDEFMDTLHRMVSEELGKMDWEVTSFVLRQLEIGDCMGCFACWVQNPGRCLYEDDSQMVLQKYINSDVVIYLTPVVFGGYSYHLKRLVDRSIGIVSPFFTRIDGEVHHKLRYDSYPDIIGMGVLPREDEESEEIFETLIYRNSINYYSPDTGSFIIVRDWGEEEIEKKIGEVLGVLEVEV